MKWEKSPFFEDDTFEYGYDEPCQDIKSQPVDDDSEDAEEFEEFEEPELLEYDDWNALEEDETPVDDQWLDTAEPEPEIVDEDEPLPTDTEHERSRKMLRREMKAEALRRMEEAARTVKDFEAVTDAWDKRDNNRGRTIRNHEQYRGDIPLEYGAKNFYDSLVFPAWMNDPMERQITSGYFLDYLAFCPYEMHDLTASEHIRNVVASMKEDHKELLFFMDLLGKSPQEMAVLRKQTDRNIRKVRDTTHRKIRKRLYKRLIEMEEYGYHPTQREAAFMARYEAEMEDEK